MSFFSEIIRFFFYFFLKFKRPAVREHQPVSLLNAQKIGILFYADNIRINDIILAFSQKLKNAGKEVEVLGYIPKSELGFVFPFPFITNKDVSWYGKPCGSISESFIHSIFDLVINFHTEECLPFEYICAVSSAKFRIGFRSDADIANYDLILISKENKEISNLIQNLEHYLK
ncbi:MAG: hypothetical protein IPM95_08065 [Sphingobacteriales bacterium]|nr:hypothetical protein [Sphingobacteriales bacterium]